MVNIKLSVFFLLIKALLKSIVLTIITIVIISQFFLSSFMGLFGYSAIPLSELTKLKASSQIMEKMKSRHKTKKVNATKKFYKKAGKKVSATAISAATLGTIAVVGTLTYLEVSQYCEEQKDLIADENILFSTHKVFDSQACLSRAKQDSLKITDEAIKAIKHTSIEASNIIIDGADSLLEPSRKEIVKFFEYIDEVID